MDLLIQWLEQQAIIIQATAWQKHFICRCHYLCCYSQWKSLITWTDFSNGHIDEGYCMSLIRDGTSASSIHTTSVQTYPAKHMVCQISVYAATIQTGHDMPVELASMTQFLCCACVCRFCFVYCDLRFYAQSHSDNNHVLHVLHVHLLRLTPQCPTLDQYSFVIVQQLHAIYVTSHTNVWVLIGAKENVTLVLPVKCLPVKCAKQHLIRKASVYHPIPWQHTQHSMGAQVGECYMSP